MRFVLLCLVFILCLEDKETVAQTAPESAPYNVVFSKKETHWPEDMTYSEKIIGVNEKSLFILFKKKFGYSYAYTKFLTLKKYHRKTLKLQKEVSLYRVLKEMKCDIIHDIQFVNGSVVVFFSHKHEVKAIVFNDDLEIIARNDKMFISKKEDYVFTFKVNEVRQEYLIIEYPFTNSVKRQKGRYLRFDTELNALQSGEIDLSFLLAKKKKFVEKNLDEFLQNVQFTDNNHLVSVSAVTQKGYDVTSSRTATNQVLYILNLDSETPKLKYVQVGPEAVINETEVLVKDNKLILSGFYIEGYRINGLVGDVFDGKVIGSFIYQYAISTSELLSKAIVPFEKQHSGSSGFNDNYVVQRVYYDQEVRKAVFVCEYVDNQFTATPVSSGMSSSLSSSSYVSRRGSFFVFALSLDSGKVIWKTDVTKSTLISSQNKEVYDQPSLISVQKGKELHLLYYSGKTKEIDKNKFPFYSSTIDLESGDIRKFESSTEGEAQWPSIAAILGKMVIGPDGMLYSFSSKYKKFPKKEEMKLLKVEF